MAGTIKVTYATNGAYQAAYNGKQIASGTYTYADTTLTLVVGGKTATRTVTDLTQSRLLLVSYEEDASSRYTNIDTYTR